MSNLPKPSPSKSGQLKRQASVNSSGGNSQENPSPSESFLQSLNPRSTLLLRAELPKPMSRLPEIRFERGSGGMGDKTQVGQVKPQKSCESYDSTASVISWSSSQSAVTAGGGHCNSTPFLGNPSFCSFEEGEELDQTHLSQQIDRIPSMAGAPYKSQYLPRRESSQQATALTFRTGYSFDELGGASEEALEQVEGNQPHEESNEVNEDSISQAAVFFQSVFDEQEKEYNNEGTQSSLASPGGTKKKSFKRFWKLAYKAIRSEAGKINEASEVGLSKKENKSEPTEVEVDPVYQLLKSAASQGQIVSKPATPFDQSESTKRTPSVSSNNRA